MSSTEVAAPTPRSTEVTRTYKILVLTYVFVPIVVAILTIYFAIGITWLNFWLSFVMFCVTGFGITVGYHRLLTHASFEAKRPVKLGFAIAGSMAFEGPPIDWVARHAEHHVHSDDEDDTHSPHVYGTGFWNKFKGFFLAHMGWFMSEEVLPKEYLRHVKHLERDAGIMRINRLYWLWVLLSFTLPSIIAFLLTFSYAAAGTAFLWAVVRVCVILHLSWSVNSVGHLFGSQPFDRKEDNKDQSKNSVWLGLAGFGEGWHANHHEFPNSARHGLFWWQIDTSWIVIKLLSWVRLVRNIRVPSKQAVTAKLKTAK
jgi:stearoyl-CoA desaturase (Delta-9 desaturase)